MSKPYDPQDEEGRSSTGYVTRKDLRAVIFVVILLGVLGTPVYHVLKKQRDQHLCTQNLATISKAVELYAADNEDQFPPICMTDLRGTPLMFNHGPRTWVSLTQRYAKNLSYKCPAADQSEVVVNEPSAMGPTIESTYGLYGALAAQPKSAIANPGLVGLIGDTSNGGALDSYDPRPFVGNNGQKIPDGFLIGLDSSNFTPLDNSRKDLTAAKAVTRLAFRGAKDGKFGKDTTARHDEGVNVVTADGHLLQLKPGAALVTQRAGTGPTGTWGVP